MSIIALVLGFAIVWAFGSAVVLALLRPGTEPRNGQWALVTGTGWFVGAFALTIVMRVLSAAHVPFAIATIVVPLAVLLALLGWRDGRDWRRYAGGSLRALTGADLVGWQRAVWLVVLGWLALRFALLLGDVVWRPLYPWDAWTQWGTKARVWFELRQMAPFVSAGEWMQANNADVYFDSAPYYPGTVPLLQTYAATLLGRWDDSLVNLPWWLTAVAFGLAIYGALVRAQFALLFALLGTWLVLSLPILDAHVALAGYADLPMACYLTLAAIFALRAIEGRTWGEVTLAVILAGACVLIKNPGKVWIVALVPGLIVALLPTRGRRIALAGLAMAIGAMLVLAQTEPVLLGYHLHLDFGMPWSALADAYFAFGNWHLLWYGCIAIALVSWRHLLQPPVAPYTMFVAAGMLFLMFGFAFTNARVWVEDQSTVNRATLHLAPLAIVWMLFAFRAWAEQYAVPTEPASPPLTSAPA